MKHADQTNRGLTIWPFVTSLLLILLPLVLFGGVGAWALWNEGHLLWLSWTLPVCWGMAWVVMRTWKQIEVPLPEFGVRGHWTRQDQAALAIVESERQRLDGVDGRQLLDLLFYQDRTVELATKLAQHYHPKAVDPLDKLSVVEILTVVELVSQDLEEWFQAYIPGSHLITVGQWRSLALAPGWWKAATNVGWAASIAMNPSAALGRYALSKIFVDPVTNSIQSRLLIAFYMLYIRKVGYYLIELNSGRLRGGAAVYRRAMARLEPSAVEAAPETAAPEPVTVTIAVIGQVKAGKSSLVNCLLGDQRAAVDILPLTRDVDRYDLRIAESGDRLVLLDTPGYSDAGATREQKAATREAVRQADLILLVMAATSPARQADAAILQELDGWFREQNRLKPPPVIGIVSKIDGLRPVMEWAPPYDWQHPSRQKEQSIHEAVEYARQSVQSGLQLAVPVCTDRERGRVYGIEEWLLPTIIVQLDEARAVSLVRSLHQDHDRLKLLKVFSQLVEAGKRITDEIRKMRIV